MHFFWPNLRCEVIEQMVKSHYLVEFPTQKKEPKWFQNLGRFKKNSSAQWPKKRPKNWTGPCLSLNMVRRNRFLINLQARQNQKRGLCRVQLVREQLRAIKMKKKLNNLVQINWRIRLICWKAPPASTSAQLRRHSCARPR